jgi:hypothetical protein
MLKQNIAHKAKQAINDALNTINTMHKNNKAIPI